MKQTLLSILLMLLPIVANADTVEIDGIWYNLDAINQTAEVTHHVGEYYSGSVTIPSSVSYDNITYNVNSIGDSAFKDCTDLMSVQLPESVSNIGRYAFQGCSYLTSINIPSSVTSIKDCTFMDCRSLMSITIPDGVISIGDIAFGGCESLSTIMISNSLTTIGTDAFYRCNFSSLSFPKSLKHIGSDAFDYCSNLISVSFTNDVFTFDDNAFDHCKKLASVHITDLAAWCESQFGSGPSNPLVYAHHLFLNGIEVKELIIPEGVTYIGKSTFFNCNELSSIDFPNSLISIGDAAFGGCGGLTSLTIPNNVTSIGNNAFQSCGGLVSVDINDGLITIGEASFGWCYNLVSVNLPNTLKVIKNSAFCGCPLNSITIPESVEYIYQNAFGSCNSLEVINAQPTTPPFLYDNSFPDYTVPVNVPSGCSDAYREAQGWSNFTTFNDGNVYYNLSVTTGKHGKASYSNQGVKNSTRIFNVQEGSNATITITADAGYQIATATINGEDVMSSIVNGVLTISNIVTNKTVEVTFSRTSDHTTVTMGSTGMATYCPMDDVDFSTVSGLKAYTATGYDHGTLTVSRVLNAPAGTGLLLQGTAGSYDVPYATSTGYYINLLHGLTTDTQLSPTQGGYTNFILGDKGGVVSFYRLSEAGVVAAGKAYLQLPTSVVEDVVSGSRVMRIVAEDETTGIRSVELLTNNVRGKGEELFDLQGRRVANPSKGIYIVGGQKVVVK